MRKVDNFWLYLALVGALMALVVAPLFSVVVTP